MWPAIRLLSSGVGVQSTGIGQKDYALTSSHGERGVSWHRRGGRAG